MSKFFNLIYCKSVKKIEYNKNLFKDVYILNSLFLIERRRKYKKEI